MGVGFLSSGFGVRGLLSGVRCQVVGVSCQVFDVWVSGFGVRGLRGSVRTDVVPKKGTEVWHVGVGVWCLVFMGTHLPRVLPYRPRVLPT